jgi:hypothetical protein
MTSIFFLLLWLLPVPFIVAATIEESARTESEVVLYNSLNNEPIVTLIEAFKKKYPFIKPSFYRATSERVLQRAITEARASDLWRAIIAWVQTVQAVQIVQIDS